MIEETLCPLCGGPMAPRTSARGKFWGCKAFPRCRGTRNSDGEAPRRQSLESEPPGWREEHGLPSERARGNDRRRW